MENEFTFTADPLVRVSSLPTQLVRAGLASRAEIQIAYAIGISDPIAVKVDTFGTGDAELARRFVEANFDFRPSHIAKRLRLLRPIYRHTTNYGHFGKPGLPWEEDDNAN